MYSIGKGFYMELNRTDVITVGKKRYLIVETLNYGGIVYHLVNKLVENDEPSKEYIVITVNNDSIIEVNEKNILDKVLPIFSQKVQAIIENFNK